jgi:flagellar biosynthesis/type III secretory pathway ATPase
MEVTRFSETCKVKQATNTTKVVDAEVHEFKEHRNLTVVLNKSVKLPMTWNGKVYEGRMAGIDFISDGPSISKSKTSRG